MLLSVNLFPSLWPNFHQSFAIETKIKLVYFTLRVQATKKSITKKQRYIMDKISKKQILTGKYGLVGGQHSNYCCWCSFCYGKSHFTLFGFMFWFGTIVIVVVAFTAMMKQSMQSISISYFPLAFKLICYAALFRNKLKSQKTVASIKSLQSTHIDHRIPHIIG